jgi:ketose-bisphosphate aldolase
VAILSGIQIIEKRSNTQKAIPSFDIAGGSIDIIYPIFEQLQVHNCAAFLSSTPASINAYYGMDHYVKEIRNISEIFEVDVAIHLDHAQDPNDVKCAIDSGFSSVMYDGSKLAFEENKNITTGLAKYAKDKNVSIEAELGIIKGKEDEIISESSISPPLAQCLEFIESTRIEYFAPAIGTVHGNSLTELAIDWKLATELSKLSPIPLVLHGGTGLDKEILLKLIHLEFSKVNFATGVRDAFGLGVRNILTDSFEGIKPQIYLKEGSREVSLYCSKILKIFTL